MLQYIQYVHFVYATHPIHEDLIISPYYYWFVSRISLRLVRVREKNKTGLSPGSDKTGRLRDNKNETGTFVSNIRLGLVKYPGIECG